MSKYEYNAEISQLMNIIINSFYSNKDVYLRELISNSSDAMDKYRIEKLSSGESVERDLKIQIISDKNNKTITINDFGIGMTKEDMINNLGTIAKSGTKGFLEKIKENQSEIAKKENINVIGQFGVGFYSAFLVADKIEVISRHYLSDKTFVWSSHCGGSSYEINESELLQEGTSIILHIRENDSEYLEESKCKDIVSKHSNFINYPIQLLVSKEITVEKNEEVSVVEDVTDVHEVEKKIVMEFEQINSSKPLWLRSKNDLTDEDYQKFYKSFYSSDDDAIAHTHFSTEGSNEIIGIFFIPKKAPSDMFSNEKKEGSIKLYVRRVFINDNKEILPNYLSFVNGIVDSNDLPLNASRELLQSSKLMKQITNQCVKKCINMMENIPEDKYDDFYNNYHKNIKLGVYEDDTNRNKLSHLLRFYTLEKSDKPVVSLKTYIESMKDEQKDIYYITGESINSTISNPILETLKNRGLNVLLLVDPIDEYCIQKLDTYMEKKLVCVTKDNFKLDEVSSDLETEFKPFCEYLENQIGSSVTVRITNKLLSSPCTVIANSWGMSANMERIVKAQTLSGENSMMSLMTKKTLEINPEHELIKKIRSKYVDDNDYDQTSTVQLLYQSALLASGYAIENASDLAKKIQEVLIM